jgi:hypothetical protein
MEKQMETQELDQRR